MTITSLSLSLFLACVLAPTLVAAELVKHGVTDSFEGRSYAHAVVYPAGSGPFPTIVMVPNWMGPTPGSLEKAGKIAGMGYAVAMVDVYSTDVRPTNSEEAGKAATELRAGDRAELRKRTARAVEVVRGLADTHPIDPKRVAAIGFCFGGCAVLELARSGSDVKAVASFHGNLDTTMPASSETLKSKVLVLHGADDPLVPVEQVAGFMQEMATAKADYVFSAYGGAVHSFTNPQANMPGTAMYHADAARRSFVAMHEFFTEVMP